MFLHHTMMNECIMHVCRCPFQDSALLLPAGNIRPVVPLPQAATETDSSPEAVAKALLSHIPEPGFKQGSPRLLPPAAESTAELQTEPLPEPDLRQCYQIVNGCLTAVPLQLVLPKPKPKGAMKKGLAAGGPAGTDFY